MIVFLAPSSESVMKRRWILSQLYPIVQRVTIALDLLSQDGQLMNVLAITALAQLDITVLLVTIRFGLQLLRRRTQRPAPTERTVHRLEHGLLTIVCLALQVGCAPPPVQ